MTDRTDDRRRFAREPAAPNRIALEWWSGAQDRECVARLVDISRGGARIEADAAPPIGHPVWFRLEAPAVTPWVRAQVIRHEDPSGTAVAFDGTCPDDVLLAATLGIALDFGLTSGRF